MDLEWYRCADTLCTGMSGHECVLSLNQKKNEKSMAKRINERKYREKN